MSEETSQTEAQGDGWEWAAVEVMGHRSHAGRIREEEKFGAKMLRIDVPIDGDPAKGWSTHLYAASALFSLRYTDEATVMKANKPYVSPYRITHLEEAQDEPERERDPAEEALDPSPMDELDGYR